MHNPPNKLWYQQAVFYELIPRSFYDSNNDGWGDLAGITAKLDYLQWLGMDCIWLLPFFASPMKDGGYDVSDFYSIHPKLGTLEDFKQLITEAHARNIKVIGDLVLNHTSDQHAWFQEARKPNSPKHDWYVWSDTPTKYADARVVLNDIETSNWEWDTVADAYYWHRFYKHQPDLNYDNPEVFREICNIARYWLELGMDGFRLDAAQHLCEREGTSCEGLPETHKILQKLRTEVEKIKPHAILLAEASHAAKELTAYFNNGDECNMALHFPAMNEIFQCLHTEDSKQLFTTLAKTSNIPANCQWATFLRSHDGITTRHLPEDQRESFINFYAPQQKMRHKGGPCRRLAPMLGFSLPKLKVAYALLLSLLGAPIIYYGDDIGMGDNLELSDRDPLRTPMPWSDIAPNAGFSTAPTQKLALPLAKDKGGWQEINVENAQKDQSSFLNWLRNTLALRKQYPSLQLGNFVEIPSDNTHIASYLREYQGEKTLVLINVSSSSQNVNLHTDKLLQTSMIELLTQQQLFTTDKLRFTLKPYDIRWLYIPAQ